MLLTLQVMSFRFRGSEWSLEVDVTVFWVAVFSINWQFCFLRHFLHIQFVSADSITGCKIKSHVLNKILVERFQKATDYSDMRCWLSQNWTTTTFRKPEGLTASNPLTEPRMRVLYLPKFSQVVFVITSFESNVMHLRMIDALAIDQKKEVFCQLVFINLKTCPQMREKSCIQIWILYENPQTKLMHIVKNMIFMLLVMKFWIVRQTNKAEELPSVLSSSRKCCPWF